MCSWAAFKRTIVLMFVITHFAVLCAPEVMDQTEAEIRNILEDLREERLVALDVDSEFAPTDDEPLRFVTPWKGPYHGPCPDDDEAESHWAMDAELELDIRERLSAVHESVQVRSWETHVTASFQREAA